MTRNALLVFSLLKLQNNFAFTLPFYQHFSDSYDYCYLLSCFFNFFQVRFYLTLKYFNTKINWKKNRNK